MSGPKWLGDQPIEGSYKSHQIPIPEPSKKPEQLDLLKTWLESYEPHEFFDKNAGIFEAIDKYVIPSSNSKKMGQRKETYDAYRQINLPDWQGATQEKGSDASCTKILGGYLRDVFEA
jgi:xylulose-5-phosphate/fructose-6-phosphate phosphoketolase